MKFRFVFFLSLLVLTVTAGAESAAVPQLDRLKAELDAFVSGLKPEQRVRYDGGASLHATVARLAADFERQNYESVEQQLKQLPQTAPTPGVIKLTSELLELAQAGREKRDAATLARVEAIVARTSELCLKATKEKELDELLTELAQLRPALNRNGSNDAFQRAAQKLDAAANFTRRWQDYLAQFNAGNVQAASQIMSELASNSRTYPILPRSELLARVRPTRNEEPAAAAAKPIAFEVEITSLEDLPAGLEKLQPLMAGKTVPAEIRDNFTNLVAIQNGVNALANGNLAAALQSAIAAASNTSHASPKAGALHSALRRQLLLRLLPRYLSVAATFDPAADENPSDYLLRVVKQAKAGGDWSLVARALEAYNRTAFPSGTAPEWLQSDRQALTQYLVGLNQERAGDIAGALSSYQLALRTPSQNVPIEDIATRIKALRKAQADERLGEQERTRQRALLQEAEAKRATPSAQSSR